MKDKASKLIMLKDKVYERKMNKLLLLNNSLSDNNPAKLLMNGYVKVFSEDKVVKSVKQLNVNDEIKISFADGKVLSKITDIEV
jgi:exonuclease VII large subunit